MNLVLEVERNGKTDTVEVATELADWLDTARVLALCGPEALTEMAKGVFNPDAARAILYVNLVHAVAEGEIDWSDPPIAWDECVFDDLPAPDVEFEADIPMETP